MCFALDRGEDYTSVIKNHPIERKHIPDTATAEPVTTTSATPAKTKTNRGVINKAHLDELADARKVAAAALDTDHLAALAAVECDPALAPAINTLADKIETGLGLLSTSTLIW